ncbi:MAG: helix-turn-helix domain-containing protein [Clostridia bacterium]
MTDNTGVSMELALSAFDAPVESLRDEYEAAAAMADTHVATASQLRALTAQSLNLLRRIEWSEQRLLQVQHQAQELVNTYPIANRPEFDELHDEMAKCVERWCTDRPTLGRRSAWQRVTNAVKREFRYVLRPPENPGRPSRLPMPKEVGHLRLQNLPLARYQEAIAFLKALPTPGATHLSPVRVDSANEVPERAWGLAEGEGLRRVRQTCGLSVRELADRIFFASNTIYHWEAGRCAPSADAWARLPAAFGIAPETLARWCGGFHGRS